MNIYKCPVCDSTLKASGRKYELSTLMRLWKELNVDFSDHVIAGLKSQADITELLTCLNCQLNIFLPVMNGTPEFYQELQNKMSYYEEDKWDFHEALKKVKGLSSVIEIGCGPGNFLMRCMADGIDSYGTEYNRDAMKVAEEKGIKILGPEEINSYVGFFDAVFCFHVLEHVAEPKEFMNFLIHLIKPGGKICISVPNQDGPIKYVSPCIMNMPPHHLTQWKVKTFKVLAKNMNLKIKKVSYEPLLLANHSYYSTHWANHFFKGNNRIIVRMKNIFIKYSSIFFGRLLKKYTYFRFLKGQAIYLEFKKN